MKLRPQFTPVWNVRRMVFSMLLFYLFLTAVRSQNLEGLADAKPFIVSGSISGGMNYFTKSLNTSLDPLGYNVNLNLNFKLYDVVNIPVSIGYSNLGASLSSLSLKRFGMSPSYKGITLHAGYRSFQLAPNLMSGMTLLGGGLEWNRSKFRILAFTGKMADDYNFAGGYGYIKSPTITFYKRHFYGGKISFGSISNSIELAMFSAKDDPTSGAVDSLYALGVRAQQNFGVALGLSQRFFRILTFGAHVSSSLFSRDAQARPLEADAQTTQWIDRTEFLAQVNESTRIGFAYDGSISLAIKSITMGLKYEHIDPFYKTLGLLYNQQNFDNYLFNVQGNFDQGKLYFSGNVGLQFNNAEEFTGQRVKRIIGNGNASYRFSKKSSLSLSYNNYNQNSAPQLVEVEDSLQFITNSQGWSANYSSLIGSDKSPHRISGYISHNSFDLVNLHESLVSSNALNGNINYLFSKKAAWSAGGGLIFTSTTSNQTSSTTRYGILGNVGKEFTRALKVKLNGAYRLNRTGNTSDGNVINIGMNAQWEPLKNHRLTFGVQWLDRNTQQLTARKDLRLRAQYYQSF